MTRRLLDEYGLAGGLLDGAAPDADVSSEDPQVVARGKEAAARAPSRSPSELGAEALCGVLYSALGEVPRAAERRSAARHVVTALQRRSRSRPPTAA